jgi:hypothetical protein
MPRRTNIASPGSETPADRQDQAHIPAIRQLSAWQHLPSNASGSQSSRQHRGSATAYSPWKGIEIEEVGDHWIVTGRKRWVCVVIARAKMPKTRIKIAKKLAQSLKIVCMSAAEMGHTMANLCDQILCGGR